MDAEEKPLLTYCLVTYNQEKYVRESVLSAFAQTYSPLEIVLSDDCSTDRTFEIMRELAAGYRGPHRIILNRNERNLGLGMHASKVWGELSSGRWLIGAAGDDISLPERAEAVARAAQQYPEAACIWSGCDFIDGEGAGLPHSASAGEHGGIYAYRNTIPAILGATVAYRRDVYSEFGPLGGEVRNEDIVMSLRSLLLGEFVRIDAPLVKYRKHDSNLSGKFTDGRDKIERMRFRLGYAHLQQLADLQKYLEKHPEQYRRIARLRRRVSDNYIVSQFCSAFCFCPSCRLHLVIEALTSPRYWRIAAARIWKRFWR